ncbi:hypothetical protein KM176_01150 [Pseudooceanicola sp. CBS1P-1]|uniref:Lipoprotein n=1 Tax=Pseudooceanicola albus TaxID=2692189 RepID=A0A6L7G332_9RHOB|nr:MULTISPECIES: hypothetical protein [Pseudooceanicola]MBT9382452.1 hypothetical protein [Pseudooceanicola endophyticus]MXN16993.1 hypothetical protein [Pseudooceanicola albus]
MSPPSRPRAAALLAAALLLTLPGCSPPNDTSKVVPQSNVVQDARHDLLGFSKTRMRMCAGFPTATVQMDETTDIWTYAKSGTRSGVAVSLPSVDAGPLEGSAGTVSVSGGATCSMQVRFVSDKVAEVDFAGDSNTRTELYAYCVPLVDNCVREAQLAQGR